MEVAPRVVAEEEVEAISPVSLEDKYSAALAKIKNPDPEDYHDLVWGWYEDVIRCIGFEFSAVFHPWLRSHIPAWPAGSLTLHGWEDVYREKEDGPPVLAFICREGIIVAVDHSVGGVDNVPSKPVIIKFNPHVIGCVAKEVADSGILLRDIPQEVRFGTAVDVLNWLVETRSSRCPEALSGIVIAGWDSMGPRLFCVDPDGELHQGVAFACGSCSEFGYVYLAGWNFPFMSITEAAKLARVTIPTAVALGKAFNGESDDLGDEAGESGRVGASVKVYCVGPRGYEELVDDGEEEVTAEKMHKAEDGPLLQNSI